MENWKVVDNVFKFLWNRWNIQTASEIFGRDLGEHIFYSNYDHIEAIWASLDNECKKKLVEYADNFYSRH